MHAGNKETLDEVEAEENGSGSGFGDGEDDYPCIRKCARCG